MDQYSSFLFLGESVFMAHVAHEDVYSILFLFLFFTSVAYRAWPSTATLLLDKLAIVFVVVYGALCLLERTYDDVHLALIVASFVAVVYLYYGGHRRKQYCFAPNPVEGAMWHSIVHVISCIGHAMIVWRGSLDLSS